jgi:hypothetical protein
VDSSDATRASITYASGYRFANPSERTGNSRADDRKGRWVSHKGAGRAAASRIWRRGSTSATTAADGARGFCQGLRMGDDVVGTLPIVQFGFPGELRDRLVLPF